MARSRSKSYQFVLEISLFAHNSNFLLASKIFVTGTVDTVSNLDETFWTSNHQLTPPFTFMKSIRMSLNSSVLCFKTKPDAESR